MTVFAMLEERGYRRDQIKNLTRSYVRMVLMHPRDEKGALDVNAYQEVKEEEPVQDVIRRKLYKQKFPRHLMSERIREWVVLKARIEASWRRN